MRMKMVRDRRKSARGVESSVDVHGGEVAVNAAAFFAGWLKPGETMPCFLMLFELLRRVLASARERLVSAAARHLREIDGDDKARRLRDELKARLESKGRRLRDVLDALYGDGSGLEMAGLDRQIAREPVDLLGQTERIIERFSGNGPEVGEPELGGFDLTPKSLVDDLEPDYEQFSKVVDRLTREDRKSDATLILKDEAMKEYDRIFRLTAGIIAAFFSLAGHEELARRVIPSVRRAGRTQADVDEEAKAEAGSGDEPEAAEAEAES